MENSFAALHTCFISPGGLESHISFVKQLKNVYYLVRYYKTPTSFQISASLCRKPRRRKLDRRWHARGGRKKLNTQANYSLFKSKDDRERSAAHNFKLPPSKQQRPQLRLSPRAAASPDSGSFHTCGASPLSSMVVKLDCMKISNVRS